MRLALSCVLLLLLDLADITSCGKKLSGTRRNRNLLATSVYNGSDSVNPVESWNFFKKQTNKRNKGKEKKNSKESSKSHCNPSSGPPGPPGPPGPVGPPGAQVTEAFMMAEFRSMVQGTVRLLFKFCAFEGNILSFYQSKFDGNKTTRRLRT